MSHCKSLTVTVEIPKGSRLKYEVDKKTGRLVLDRVLRGACVYPYNYGYVDKTLDGDGDPLDVVIISQETLHPGVDVVVRPLAAIKMIDGGEGDTKMVGVIAEDSRYDSWQTAKDIPEAIKHEIHDFFINYKNLEKKKVEINGWIEDKEELEKAIEWAFEHYKNNK